VPSNSRARSNFNPETIEIGDTVSEGTGTGTGTTPATSGNLSFQVTFKEVVYTIDVYAPDANKQYGFTVTYEDTSTNPATTVTVASLIYKDESDWQVIAALPKSLQLDTNLTVNQLSIDLTEGTVSALSSTASSSSSSS
jgi:hypothetical protein